MRLLRADGDDLVLETFHDESQKYAILSHRWLADNEEVTYADIVKRDGSIGQKAGLKKLNWCRQQAVRDGFQYIWADTACIDKSSSQELTESINSMFRWYGKAEVCYVYLHDMPDHVPDTRVGGGDSVLDVLSIEAQEEAEKVTSTEGSFPRPARGGHVQIAAAYDALPDHAFRSNTDETRDSRIEQQALTVERIEASDVESRLNEHDRLYPFDSITTRMIPTPNVLEGWSREAFAKAEWFRRAWTLQELIAPGLLKFYSQAWTLIGELRDVAPVVAEITGIQLEVLTKERPLIAYTIAQKMSWAAGRQSTKVEDRAVSVTAQVMTSKALTSQQYSLLGIMDVSLGIIYGEGPRAFQRLQEELLRSSSDDSIFAFEQPGRVVKVRGFMTCPLLAECPEDFSNCRSVCFATWRDNKNQCQMVDKEFTFRTRVLAETNRDRTAWWKFWRRIRRWAPETIPRRAILDCSLEYSPSSMFVLNLFAFPERPDTFYIQADESRVTQLSIHEGKNKATPYKSFSVVRNPDEFEIFPSDSVLTVCRFKHTDMAMRLVEASVPRTWCALDTTFVVTRADVPLQAKLALHRGETRVATIHIEVDSLRRSGFSARLEGAMFRPHPVLRSSKLHRCTFQKVSAGIITARAFGRWKVLGGSRINYLEIEYLGPARSAWFLSCRAMCILAAVVACPFVLYLGFLLSLLTCPPACAILIALFAKGSIGGPKFFIGWNIAAIVWISVYYLLRSVRTWC